MANQVNGTALLMLLPLKLSAEVPPVVVLNLTVNPVALCVVTASPGRAPDGVTASLVNLTPTCPSVVNAVGNVTDTDVDLVPEDGALRFPVGSMFLGDVGCKGGRL